MKLDFYYFSDQCPLHDDIIQLLDAYREKLEINLHDISHDGALTEKMRMFFPMLTVLNGEKRYYAPLNRVFLDQASQGLYPQERPFLPALSETVVTETIEPLTLDQVKAACACCGRPTARNCEKKQAFLRGFGREVYGFLHMDADGHLIGGAEYLPSMCVPYGIAHEPGTAFITCVYMSDAQRDTKSAPLRALEAYLRTTYEKVIAISDERGVFPNGDLHFFLRNGYRDEGVVYEDASYCRLHLVSKCLQSPSSSTR